MTWPTVFFWLCAAAIFSEYVQLISDRGTFLGSILGRSKCDSCGKEIPWFALVPFVGRFITKKRCVYCGKQVSWKYFSFELAFTIIWGVIMLVWSPVVLATPLVTTILFVLYCATWLLMYEDAKRYSVPVSWLVSWVLLFGIAWYICGAGTLFWLDMGLMAIVLGLSVGFVALRRRAKITEISSFFGGADTAVLAVFALFLGFQKTTYILILAVIASGIYLVIQRRLRMGQRVPLLTTMLLWGYIALLL